MLHFDVNWLAIVLAMVASMAFGAGYYGILGNQWVAATGKSRDDLMGSGGSATPFIIGAICQLVMAYFMTILTPALMETMSVYNSIMVGIAMWVAFVITSMIINHRYQNQKWSLTLIDGGYLLAVLVIQGLVLGLFG